MFNFITRIRTLILDDKSDKFSSGYANLPVVECRFIMGEVPSIREGFEKEW